MRVPQSEGPVHKQNLLDLWKAHICRGHHGRAHQNVEDLAVILAQKWRIRVLKTGPDQRLQLRKSPKVDHRLIKQVLQESRSVVLEAPQKKDAAIKERVLSDFPGVV